MDDCHRSIIISFKITSVEAFNANRLDSWKSSEIALQKAVSRFLQGAPALDQHNNAIIYQHNNDDLSKASVTKQL
jgi:hypothetical protein